MKKTRSILIVGGSGFVGSYLALALRDEYKVFATYHSHPIQIPGVTCVPMSLGNENEAMVKRLIFMAQPEVVIFAAGSNDSQWVEAHQSEADQVHVGSLSLIGNASDAMHFKMIYLSNGYVFDGAKGNYRENELGLAPNILGKIKVAGENFVRGRFFNHLIIRSSPVIGRGNGLNLSSFDLLKRKLERGERVELANDEFHCPAPVQGLVDLIKRNLDYASKYKLIHYGGLTKITPYQFGQQFAERFGFSPQLVIEKNNPERRAANETGIYDFSLNSSLAIANLNIQPFFLEQSFDLIEKLLVPGA